MNQDLEALVAAAYDAQEAHDFDELSAYSDELQDL